MSADRGRRDTVETCHHTGGPRAQSGETRPQHCQHPHHGHHGHCQHCLNCLLSSQRLIYYSSADPSLSLCGNQSPRMMIRQQKLSCILMRSCTEHAGAAQDSYDQCLAPDCILQCPPYLSSDLGLVAPLSPAPHATAATAATSGQWTVECC